MAADKQPVLITGIGLLSSHGEGPQAHLDAMAGGKPANVNIERFAPYPVHALGEVDWSQQISRRDMRQMEGWQRIGTYAAGLALDDAGAKDNEELCGRMDMIIAAGGGERDVEVDASVMEAGRTANDREALLNERLSNDLRPTLFLAQLSNLLAGNISIVHKVTGSSRTFMGEEGAGISAIRTAFARVESGQSDIVLVGGAFNGEREDMLLLFELGHYLTKDELQPVWSREGHKAGFAQGSIGAFLVLESADHAKKRGAKAYARLNEVIGEHGRRTAGAGRARLNDAWNRMPDKDFDGVMSGATGAAPATAMEASWLRDGVPDLPVRAFGSLFGHGVEAQFPLGIALAALSVNKGEMPPPFEGAERPAAKPATAVLVTGVGHHRSEGLGVVTKLKDEGQAR